MHKKVFWFRYLPVSLMMVGIFFLSHQPGDSLDLPRLPQIDKAGHIMIYGLLALAAYYPLHRKHRFEKSWQVSSGVVLFCLIYGLTDEVHQSFIPGRFPSGLDLVADVFGALLAMLAVYVWQRRRCRPV